MRLFFCIVCLAGSLLSSSQALAQVLDSATILHERGIEITVSDATARLHLKDLNLFSSQGTQVGLSAIVPRRAGTFLLVPDGRLDPRLLHSLVWLPGDERITVRRDAWFSSLYSSKPLGAVVSEDGSETVFRLFAPRATAVRLHLFLDRDAPLDEPSTVVLLSRDGDGVWETTQAGDHHGVYYTYTVDGPDEPGNAFHGTNPVHITDPYALVSDDSWGKARVWRDESAPSTVKGGRPPMEDVVAYEVHVQDFTDALPVEDDLKGTFNAMATRGLVNEHGRPIGFDHIVELGVNVVHLMPVQEFLHYPDAEWREAFADDPYMIEQDVARENYQWGYRTTHALAVESRFRKRGDEPGEERAQFKALVDAFHREGISVIIDVVPNHTGENMDGRHLFFNFNAIDLPYYYRTDDSLRHIGPFGNEIKTEERPMVQRWVLDQLRHWVDVLGVDGFRIDLAGQLDEQTLKWIKSELPDDLIIYGEPWIAPSDPAVASDPDFGWYKVDSPITFFQDDARNAFKGPVSNPTDPAVDRGFAGGDGSVRERAMLGLTNGFAEEGDPNRGLNYLDIHDNWALADRFSDEDWNGLLHVDEAAFRLAATLLFTSLGPLVVHGGTEFMRSKAHAPLEELIKETATGPLYFHGKRDTYNLRLANRFLWNTLGETEPVDYDAMFAFWKGLIAFRASGDGAVFRVGGAVPEDGYYRFMTPDNTRLLGYMVDEQVLVLMNTGQTEAAFDDVTLPDGQWRLISDGERVDVAGVSDVTVSGQMTAPTLPPQTSRIWIRTEGRP